MATLFPEVEFPRAMRFGNFAFGKLHAQLNQLGDPGGPLFDDRADDVFLAQPGARFKRIAHVQLKRILLAGDRRNASLGIIGVRFGAVLFGDDRNAPVSGNFQSERKSSDATAQN